MPHLDSATYASQLFWLFTTFVALYAIMTFVVLPAIGGVLETRGNKIQSDLSEAQNLKNQAETFANQQQKLMQESSQKAQKLIDESSNAAKLQAEKKRGVLMSELDKKLAMAENEIVKAQKTSSRETKMMVQELGEQIAAKIIKAA